MTRHGARALRAGIQRRDGSPRKELVLPTVWLGYGTRKATPVEARQRDANARWAPVRGAAQPLAARLTAGSAADAAPGAAKGTTVAPSSFMLTLPW